MKFLLCLALTSPCFSSEELQTCHLILTIQTLYSSSSDSCQTDQEKMGKQENRDIRDRDADWAVPLGTVIRKERAEELARAGMGNNAARNRRAMAVLKSALTKQ